ncbi:MAG: GNAT family N-acetyltransferase [Bacteroidaceae bacterium]|nr:GNAT family N-acetyltransferase [Bacteroidaceae bacterium]
MFEIRKATLEDIPLINELAWIVFPHTYKELLSPGQIEFMMDWMYSPANLQKQMTEDGHTYFIAYEGNEPAGYLSIQPEGEHTYHLQKIYVLPSFQGKKLGKQLFNHAIQAIKELHPEPCQMRLNVNRYNTKAVDFYFRMGMKKVFEGDFDIGHGYLMTDYIMALDI